MNGIEYRLQAFIRPSDRRCLMVDTSAGLSLGALPGLEEYLPSVHPILGKADGVVCSPGQIGKLTGLSKTEAGLLVRMDWHNTLRGQDFVLPAVQPLRVPILSVEDAISLGSVGMVTTFLLGYEEALEAECLRTAVQYALEGKRAGLPLVVEVQPSGPRVSIPDKAVELGASYALEGGADVIALPYPGTKSLKTIAGFVSVPWLIKPTSSDTALAELQEALDLGAAGLWLDHMIFDPGAPTNLIDEARGILHPETIKLSEV